VSVIFFWRQIANGLIISCDGPEESKGTTVEAAVEMEFPIEVAQACLRARCRLASPRGCNSDATVRCLVGTQVVFLVVVGGLLVW